MEGGGPPCHGNIWTAQGYHLPWQCAVWQHCRRWLVLCWLLSALMPASGQPNILSQFLDPTTVQNATNRLVLRQNGVAMHFADPAVTTATLRGGPLLVVARAWPLLNSSNSRARMRKIFSERSWSSTASQTIARSPFPQQTFFSNGWSHTL